MKKRFIVILLFTFGVAILVAQESVSVQLKGTDHELHWNDSHTYGLEIKNDGKGVLSNVTIVVLPNDLLSFSLDNDFAETINEKETIFRKLEISTIQNSYSEKRVPIEIEIHTNEIEIRTNTDVKTRTVYVTVQPPKYLWVSVVIAIAIALSASCVVIYIKLTKGE